MICPVLCFLSTFKPAENESDLESYRWLLFDQREKCDQCDNRDLKDANVDRHIVPGQSPWELFDAKWWKSAAGHHHLRCEVFCHTPGRVKLTAA